MSRYSFGGDEHLFVEVDEAMSLDAFFKSLSICKTVREAKIAGVTEICPANASFQIKFDPDVIAADDLKREVERIEASTGVGVDTLKTRIIEIPVLYNDPWTHETLMRFRDRHQAPDKTDIEYTAEINHLDGVEGFIKAHSGAPWFVSMVGFVAGLPFLYQMVERARQIQSPKYLRPRTDTPKLTVGHGGCFGCIYSVRGAGGYQMFGVTPTPIYDPMQKVSYLREFMCLFNPGDMVKWRPIERAEYDAIAADVETGKFAPKMANVDFSAAAFKTDIDGTNAKLTGRSMAIKVVKPGLSTTVQDLGRPGYYHIGIPVSGGMDLLALTAANWLVGNEADAAVLEATFLGPELEFTEAATVAVCGAEMPPKVDGEAMPTWTAFKVARGQTLSFAYLKAGARGYIAVSGGVDVAPTLGSRSTYTLGALGGFEGRKLAAGDVLAVGEGAGAAEGRSVPETLRRRPGASLELRMMPGLYWQRITDAAHDGFFADAWKVAPEADRIGYRFRGGRPLEFVPREPPFGAGSDPSNIVDACYPYGSVQVPSGTEPIVLHRDAVSGGGYFMIGAIVSADLDLIGQLQPHAQVKFTPVDMAGALQARQDRARLLQAIRAAL